MLTSKFYLKNLFIITGVSDVLLVSHYFFCTNTDILLKYDDGIFTNLTKISDYNLN